MTVTMQQAQETLESLMGELEERGVSIVFDLGNVEMTAELEDGGIIVLRVFDRRHDFSLLCETVHMEVALLVFNHYNS